MNAPTVRAETGLQRSNAARMRSWRVGMLGAVLLNWRQRSIQGEQELVEAAKERHELASTQQSVRRE